ncbi:hypothetical protein KHM83_04190 [Fusibacter paucivorans]|uniref:Uncharacterized protein n=1 Tax=Fusibacter paucivorans TaxID=76009 RepID=A0ABS5PL19_9FIRM|nr:hypothetical protein [Fusibacter paucivorans]MBS7525875.1 hypothetical protein [Fusibacter paucivorans]
MIKYYQIMFYNVKEVVSVRKGWLMAGIVIVLLVIYVFVLKPYYFDAGLSEEEKQETSQALESIINRAKEDAVQLPDTLTEQDEESHEEAADPIETEPVPNTVGETTEPNTDSSTVPSDSLDPETASDTDEQQAKQKRIEAQYVETMEAVQTQAESLLNDLIEEAKFEYQNLTVKEKDDLLVTGKLASKYMARANELEAMIDEAVESLLADMKAELSANGFSTESVESLQITYEAAKKARREELLSKALNYQP